MCHGRRQAVCLATAGIAWIIAISSGFSVLAKHNSTPGEPGSPAGRWPASSRVRFQPGRPNLVLVAHPRCPCTRATIVELNRIMTRCQGDLAAHVLLLRPNEVGPSWEKTDLWRAAEAIPGTEVLVDEGGLEAGRFGLVTSGHVSLYDSNGALIYSGGITGARGHQGANPGRDAVVSLVTEARANCTRSAVFGCPLSALRLNPQEGF